MSVLSTVHILITIKLTNILVILNYINIKFFVRFYLLFSKKT
jgi:hypothetical protein